MLVDLTRSKKLAVQFSLKSMCQYNAEDMNFPWHHMTTVINTKRKWIWVYFSFYLFTHVSDSKKTFWRVLTCVAMMRQSKCLTFVTRSYRQYFFRQGDEIRALNNCHYRISLLSMMSTNFCIRTQFKEFSRKRINQIVFRFTRRSSPENRAHLFVFTPSVSTFHPRYHWFCTWF